MRSEALAGRLQAQARERVRARREQDAIEAELRAEEEAEELATGQPFNPADARGAQLRRRAAAERVAARQREARERRRRRLEGGGDGADGYSHDGRSDVRSEGGTEAYASPSRRPPSRGSVWSEATSLVPPSEAAARIAAADRRCGGAGGGGAGGGGRGGGAAADRRGAIPPPHGTAADVDVLEMRARPG
jgi:hypothetical protein